MPPATGRRKFGSDPNPKRRRGHIDPNIVAMLQATGQTILLHHVIREDGSLSCWISTAPQRGINLAVMTNVELQALAAFMEMAVSLADQTTRELDARAAAEYEEGHRDIYRLYRQLPVLAFRRTVFPEHFEELQGGSFPVHDLDGRIRPDPLGLAGNGDGRAVMAPGKRADVVDPYRASEARDAEDLGEVGWEPGLHEQLPSTESGGSDTPSAS